MPPARADWIPLTIMGHCAPEPFITLCVNDVRDRIPCWVDEKQRCDDGGRAVGQRVAAAVGEGATAIRFVHKVIGAYP